MPGEAGASVSFEGSRDYVVLYEEQVDLSAQLRREARKGNEVEDRFSSSVNGALLRLEDDDVNRLRKDERVAIIEPNGRVSIAAAANRSRSAASWGLDRIDQRDLPLNGTIATSQDGAGVEAYIIDTGIRLDHTQFTGRVNSEGFSAFSGGWNDCNGHGTHVAGTVAGSTYGVAPAATVTAVRVLDCGGSGSNAGVIGGIDWVVSDHRAGDPAVANMSLGGGRSESVNLAVQRAIDDGVSMVVAAGNDRGSDACGRSPASAPNAVTVGSTTRTDSVSDFSNQGRCLDLFAPGSGIVSAWHTSQNATEVLSGTSMASPHVAGVASLLLSGEPAMSPAQITERLVVSASPSRLTGVSGCTANLLAYAGSGANLPAPPDGPGGPSNDDFADHQTLSSLTGVQGTNDCASAEAGEPAHYRYSGAAASVWYHWTAPENGTVVFRTDGSSFDTVIAAYSGSSLASLSQLASDDDSGSGLNSQISFPVEGGRSYSIAVDGYAGATGNVQLSGTFAPESGVILAPAIDSGPLGPTSATQASFAFTGESDASFECRLDSAEWEACSSPRAYSNLSQGPHTFRVRQTDGTGNTSDEATRSWTVDTIAPATPSISSGPSALTSSTSASFSFTGEVDATFECQLDAGAWEACSSPRAYSGLSQGSHTFRVRQSDAAGNTSDEATRSWTVDTIAPAKPSITSGPSGTTSSTGASLSFSGEADATFECRLDSAEWEACSSPRAYSNLSQGPHTFRVRQTDGAGNASEEATRGWSVEAQLSSRPFNTSAPSVSGSAQIGQILSGWTGVWTGSPSPSFSYQWMRCTGTRCSSIRRATGSSYTVASADRGKTIRLDVVARNSVGSARASSGTVGPVPRPSRPSRLSLPSISGDLRVGSVLVGSAGEWTGPPTPAFSYQWMRCTGRRCSSIRRATSSSYGLVSADQGRKIRLDVVARNSAGSAKASSDLTGTVGAPSPTGFALPLFRSKLELP